VMRTSIGGRDRWESAVMLGLFTVSEEDAAKNPMTKFRYKKGIWPVKTTIQN